jgi:hypothetical protein
MLDELREQADEASYEGIDDEENASAYFRSRYQTDSPFLGLTAPQRLVLALMFFVMVFILGSFCLLVTESVVPPTFS